MWGNGESKLYVKESKLYSWNCCWCLLCERPGEGPWALSLCFQPGFECEWAGVTSGEPVAGLCCAQSSQALLLDRPGCGTCQCVLGAGWGTGRWVYLPRLWGSSILPSFCYGTSPCWQGEAICQPCPSVCAGRPEVLLHLLPCLACCPQRDHHFWKGVFIVGMINGANHMQTQSLKKPKQCNPLLFISGKRGNLSPILTPHCECVPHEFSSRGEPCGILEQHDSCWSWHKVGLLLSPSGFWHSALIPAPHLRHLAQARAFSIDSHFCPFVLLALSFLLCFLEQWHVF